MFFLQDLSFSLEERLFQPHIFSTGCLLSSRPLLSFSQSQLQVLLAKATTKARGGYHSPGSKEWSKAFSWIPVGIYYHFSPVAPTAATTVSSGPVPTSKSSLGRGMCSPFFNSPEEVSYWTSLGARFTTQLSTTHLPPPGLQQGNVIAHRIKWRTPRDGNISLLWGVFFHNHHFIARCVFASIVGTYLTFEAINFFLGQFRASYLLHRFFLS